MMATTSDGLKGLKTKVSARADSVGGVEPDPPLDGFPLLAWSSEHPVHGDAVFTEDQKASVHEIAIAFAETPGFAALATRFETTPEHIAQAIGYAAKAGILTGG